MFFLNSKVFTHSIQQASEAIDVSLIHDSAETQIVASKSGKIEKTPEKNAYLSDKTRVVAEQKVSKKIGVQVSDLGLKISMKPDPSAEGQKKWVQPSLGEAIQGGEYIRGMKEGEESALNTKEFVFFSYFERIRKQLDQTWQPMVRSQISKIYRRGRNLASQSEFTTRTLITISKSGEILKVTLLQESGAIDLDSAAISALNKAGPYPNPPQGLLDGTGNAQIRWDFVLKT